MGTLLIDPFGGMAGDMFLAALLDLGDPRFRLRDLADFCERMLPGEARLEATRVRRGSIEATHLDVRTPETTHPPHRGLAELLALCADAPLGESARLRADSALRAIGEAEARVHGIPLERVHFHEVGAVDTLVDVCGAAFALERLGIERALATPPFVGGGTVDCAHGTTPVPVPAVVELLGARPLVRANGGGERLTPTGAALLARWTESAPDELRIAARATGWGAGTRDPRGGRPNLVAVSLAADEGASVAGEPLRELAVNLDDATGEELGFLLEGLREAGALDAWCVPVQMKKGRPAFVVHVLAPESRERDLAHVVFARSPSLGLRSVPVRRVECGREWFDVDVLGRTVRVKRRLRPADAPQGAGYDLSPEYEDLAAIARDSGRSLRELEQLALRAARDQSES